MTGTPHCFTRLPGLLSPLQDRARHSKTTTQMNPKIVRAFRTSLLILIAVGGSAGIGWGAPISVTNASFESPASAGSPAGWVAVGNVGVWRPSIGTQVVSIPDGIQTAYIFGAGSLTQNLVATQAGIMYYLDVWVGNQLNLPGSASYTVALLDGVTVIASASGTRNPTDPFALISVSGVGLGGGTLRVQLSSNGGQPLFDSVQVSSGDIGPSGVPEPSSLALIGVGGLFVVWRKRNSI